MPQISQDCRALHWRQALVSLDTHCTEEVAGRNQVLTMVGSAEYGRHPGSGQ
ncbi:MAG: hypothetical protein IPO15_21690 [Anaerolineae bacterium]|uniref:hypothetical protein n=1 Tax=Candidatus Amarolinea dominans TaxID=3140696 RepID=UPI003134B67C|nr:hypothetical protein [Anaerolineae bacterium]